MTPKKILLVTCASLFVLFIVIQTIPVDMPESSEDKDGDLIVDGHASIEVGKILKTSCYDCHSNESNFPWYSYIAPISWLISHDVKEGRKELNFSVWGQYDTKRKIKKLEEIAEEVEEGEMPLGIYTTLHAGTSLNQQEIEIIKTWTRELRSEIIAH